MLYEIGIFFYELAVRVAALFKSKPRQMIRGQKPVYEQLRRQVNKDDRYLWFHAASLGEFEQGRPLMEAIRAQHPEYKILLTFFSPSGYEVRKDYRGADIICYLPFDRNRNVQQFFEVIQPRMAFFIKYEFWTNYLSELHKLHIPVYSVSSIFRKEQLFFRWYGSSYRKVLKNFDCLFVQNETSASNLAKVGISKVEVVGDTRFDRVRQIQKDAGKLPLVERFKKGATTLVAGSSWPADEDLVIEYFNTHPDIKLILAPHVVDERHLAEIVHKLKRPSVFYTHASEESVESADCLIIDCYGLLSSVYRYGKAAYIGGGFGAGIHNTLEAAVYGIPIIFGPKYRKFMEAVQLIEVEGACSVNNYDELHALLDRLFSDKSFLKDMGKRAGEYVKANTGATKKILSKINL
jgi:3-deoxy-D-manno-octulosonic-acid transferase